MRTLQEISINQVLLNIYTNTTGDERVYLFKKTLKDLPHVFKESLYHEFFLHFLNGINTDSLWQDGLFSRKYAHLLNKITLALKKKRCIKTSRRPHKSRFIGSPLNIVNIPHHDTLGANKVVIVYKRKSRYFNHLYAPYVNPSYNIYNIAQTKKRTRFLLKRKANFKYFDKCLHLNYIYYRNGEIYSVFTAPELIINNNEASHVYRMYRINGRTSSLDNCFLVEKID